MGKKRGVKVSEAWAVYVLGHDTQALAHWHRDVWRLRLQVFEGKARFSRLPDRFDDLLEAVGLASDVLTITPRRALALGRQLESWRGQAIYLLRELPPVKAAYSAIDWSASSPPGLGELASVSGAVTEAMEKRPHLLRWKNFGRTLADVAHQTYGSLQDGAGPLRRDLAALRREGDYKFLSPLLEFLAMVEAGGNVDATGEAFADSVIRVPTYGSIDEYIRSQLRVRMSVEPVFELNEDGVRLHGEMLPRRAFARAEWRILVYLCKNPRFPVPAKKLSEVGAVSDVSSQVSRLRKKLEPAILNGLTEVEREDSHIRWRYIVPQRVLGKRPPKYALELDPALVRVAVGV